MLFRSCRHGADPQDSGAHGGDSAAHDRDDRSPQMRQPDRGAARPGYCLPRYRGPLLRRDPAAYRPPGRDRGRPDVAAAQVPRAAVHPLTSSDRCRCGRKPAVRIRPSGFVVVNRSPGYGCARSAVGVGSMKGTAVSVAGMGR